VWCVVLTRAFGGTVVVCASNNWDGVRFHDRQLAESLCRHAPVLYVDPPTSPLTRYRRPELAAAMRGPRLRLVGPQLARLTPYVPPGPERPLLAPLTVRLVAAQVRRAVHKLGGTVHAVVESSVLVPIMGRCGEHLSAYWAQDDFVGSAQLLGLDAARLARGERDLARRADVIVAANPVVAESMKAHGRSATLVPYGCDADHFATSRHVAPAPDVTLPRPVAGFMGHLGDRIDLAILQAVVDTGCSVLLVGPRHPRADPAAMSDLLSRPNVQWTGPKAFEDLPAYLAHMDVGLLPYDFSPFNVGSFPLKTLEYLAAGLPVVATGLPAIRWLDSAHVAVADTPREFADQVAQALARGSSSEDVADRQRFAREHTWAKRAEAFAACLRLCDGTGP
jgi:glycosyltransferase involved in cell wall biosynthesis